MPIYVYGCQECGAVEEHIQRFSDPPLTECSSCRGRLEKQVTTAAFQLKGGGWYKDGYASAKAEKGDKGDKGDKGGKGDKGSKGGGSDSGSSSTSSDSGSSSASSGGSSSSSGSSSASAAAE